MGTKVKIAHWRPGERAMVLCHRLAGIGACQCSTEGALNRGSCEFLYQQAIQDVIAEIRASDRCSPEPI
jgi:hypothetical protein